MVCSLKTYLESVSTFSEQAERRRKKADAMSVDADIFIKNCEL
jgi:hypothetical protein